MPITVRLEVADLILAEQWLAALRQRLTDNTAALSEATNRVADVMGRSWRAGGSEVGGWAPLAEKTQKERARLGFGASGPILTRKRSFYDAAIQFFQQADVSGSTRTGKVPTMAKLDITPGEQGVAKMTLAGRKVALHKGGGNLPPRPIWFVNAATESAARTAVEDWLERQVREG